MYNVITVLIILACVFLVLIVLVQNPKGSGLSGSFGGAGGNQMMGVQRTTDFLEKGTWALAVSLLVLSLATSFFVERTDEGAIRTEVQEQIDEQGPIEE